MGALRVPTTVPTTPTTVSLDKMSMAHPVPAPAETVVAPAPAPDAPTTLFEQTTLHVVKAASPVTGPAAPMPASRSSINSGTWYKESHAPKPLLLTYSVCE